MSAPGRSTEVIEKEMSPKGWGGAVRRQSCLRPARPSCHVLCWDEGKTGALLLPHPSSASKLPALTPIVQHKLSLVSPVLLPPPVYSG